MVLSILVLQNVVMPCAVSKRQEIQRDLLSVVPDAKYDVPCRKLHKFIPHIKLTVKVLVLQR